MVLWGQLSNSSPTPLCRAIQAYKRTNQDHSLMKRPHRQRLLPARAPRLTEPQVVGLVASYHSGATIYELADEFDIDRRTVSARLKRQGVRLRLKSPTAADVDDMVRLYKSGLSLVKVGLRTGFVARTVQRSLWARGLRLRDSHGRE